MANRLIAAVIAVMLATPALAQAPHLGSPVVLNLAENDVGRQGTAALLEAARRQFERSVLIPQLPA